MTTSGGDVERDVPEDSDRLITVPRGSVEQRATGILDVLRRDHVALVRKLDGGEADSCMHAVAAKLGLGEKLELQARFASFKGHRSGIGQYFMSVNKREHYQFVTPHSEGDRFANMQLAAFFCFENNTDGGDTILLNVDSASAAWLVLRERTKRARPLSRALAPHELTRARALHHVNLPDDFVRDDDRVLGELPTPIAGLTLVDVLARPVSTYSRILEREVKAYWDPIASTDRDIVAAYGAMLRRWGLLKEPPGDADWPLMDAAAHCRAWSSGACYPDLFKCRVVHKLAPGDLVILNNLTWAHGVSNWRPDSGARRVAAAFA